MSVGDRGAVTVEYADGRRQTVLGPKDLVVPRVESLGAVGRLLRGVRGLLAEEFRRGGTAATRGDGDCDRIGRPPALRVPAVAATSWLVAGTTSLSLAWTGGCAPYDVVLSRDGRRVFAASELARPLVKMEPVTLEPGRHALRVRDAVGQEVGATIVVVRALPTPPRGLGARGTPAEKVAHAAWLAGEDEGAWRWAAFQELRPLIRAGDPLAATLGDVLLWSDASFAASGR